MSDKDTIEFWRSHLGMESHPEGGFYAETYRSAGSIPQDALSENFGGSRNYSTGIYFMIEAGGFSSLHRIQSDEMWHFYHGQPLTVHLINPQGEHREIRLGSNVDEGQVFQAVVPAGCWFGAEVEGTSGLSLVGCTVAPGFDFADFELAERQALLNQYPEHAGLIERLTRN